MSKPEFDVIDFFNNKEKVLQDFNHKKRCLDGLRNIITGCIEAIEIHKDFLLIALTDGRKYNWRMNSIRDNNFTVLTHTGFYERNESNLIKKYITKDSTVFDVGANKGWYSVLLGKLAVDGVVYAFEPLASAFKELESNVEINHLNNVKCINIALSNYKGTSEMIIPYGHSPFAFLCGAEHGREENRNSYLCNVTTIDNYISDNKIGAVDFMKIDAEGSEYNILLGANRLLSAKKAPMIFIESYDDALRKFDTNSKELINLLRSYGYIIHDTKDMSLVRADKDYSDTDFLCFK